MFDCIIHDMLNFPVDASYCFVENLTRHGIVCINGGNDTDGGDEDFGEGDKIVGGTTSVNA